MANYKLNRDQQLLKSYHKLINNVTPGNDFVFKDLAQLAAATKPECYNVSYQYALRCIRLEATNPQAAARKRRHPMWLELRRKVECYASRCGVSIPVALSHILASDAPSSFFITPTTAERLIRETQKAKKRPRRPLPPLSHSPLTHSS